MHAVPVRARAGEPPGADAPRRERVEDGVAPRGAERREAIREDRDGGGIPAGRVGPDRRDGRDEDLRGPGLQAAQDGPDIGLEPVDHPGPLGMPPERDVVGADDQHRGRGTAAGRDVDAAPAAEIRRSDELGVGIAGEQHAAGLGRPERRADAGIPLGEAMPDDPAVPPVAGGGLDPVGAHG
ncbi:hypothetical protein [Methylobacterium oryzae]|uniref:hypothetical protein n=1 Tax=Methylobacterium oryzae TaxID=334852 RepID=UPI002F359114